MNHNDKLQKALEVTARLLRLPGLPLLHVSTSHYGDVDLIASVFDSPAEEIAALQRIALSLAEAGIDCTVTVEPPRPHSADGHTVQQHSVRFTVHGVSFHAHALVDVAEVAA